MEELQQISQIASIIKDLSLTTFLAYALFRSEARRIHLSDFIMTTVDKLIEIIKEELSQDS